MDVGLGRRSPRRRAWPAAPSGQSHATGDELAKHEPVLNDCIFWPLFMAVSVPKLQASFAVYCQPFLFTTPWPLPVQPREAFTVCPYTVCYVVYVKQLFVSISQAVRGQGCSQNSGARVNACNELNWSQSFEHIQF